MQNMLGRLLRRIVQLLIIAIIPIISYAYIEDDVQIAFKINNREEINQYIIKGEFEPEEKRIVIEEKIRFVNNSNKSLDKIYIHIYLNGYDSGKIHIEDVENDRKKADYKIIGKNQSILMVSLNNPINQKESTNIDIRATVKLHNLIDGIDFKDSTYNINNWYAVVAVYDHNGWHLGSDYELGDSYYSDLSDYYVELWLPKEYLPVTTGRLAKVEKRGNRSHYYFSAERVREFRLAIKDNSKKTN